MGQIEKTITPEQLYKKNQNKAKIFKYLAPLIFWGFLLLTILFVSLAIENSWGNITEIITLLDKDTLTGEELEQNYAYLIEKWGEWEIAGKAGGTFSVHFVNIKNAFFSGLMVTYFTLSIVCFIIAIIIGRVLFPKLAQLYKDNNQDMVNMATLQTNSAIRKKKNEEEWF